MSIYTKTVNGIKYFNGFKINTVSGFKPAKEVRLSRMESKANRKRKEDNRKLNEK